jgi:DNA-binding CsgD family transcriptional regulator
LEISRWLVSAYILRARQKPGADSTIMVVVRAVQVGEIQVGVCGWGDQT